MPTTHDELLGKHLRVTQTVHRLDRPGGGDITTTFEGVVTRAYQGKTGSWFAHSRDGKLWLDRLELRKPDGELVVCNLDQNSQIEVVESN